MQSGKKLEQNQRNKKEIKIRTDIREIKKLKRIMKSSLKRLTKYIDLETDFIRGKKD